MKDVFRFKQFQVDQRGCAMKINTDGVLLGVFAAPNSEQVRRILDVGTGSGVIALILAQRYSQAVVDAIDIDEDSFACSKLNFRNSIFADRTNAFHIDMESFESTNAYDLIVSNPPFFIDSLKNADMRKMRSRHSSLSFYRSLFQKATELLTNVGSFVIVWPIKVRDRIVDLNYTEALNCYREVLVQSFPTSEPFRVISFFSKNGSMSYTNELFAIYKAQNVHSDRYQDVLKDFFTIF